eukprot:1461579-Rhodomonas_salina.1
MRAWLYQGDMYDGPNIYTETGLSLPSSSSPSISSSPLYPGTAAQYNWHSSPLYPSTDAEYKAGDLVQISLGYNRLTYSINGTKVRGELEGIKGEWFLGLKWSGIPLSRGTGTLDIPRPPGMLRPDILVPCRTYDILLPHDMLPLITPLRRGTVAVDILVPSGMLTPDIVVPGAACSAAVPQRRSDRACQP